jgi:hypothetical protein
MMMSYDSDDGHMDMMMMMMMVMMMMMIMMMMMMINTIGNIVDDGVS